VGDPDTKSLSVKEDGGELIFRRGIAEMNQTRVKEAPGDHGGS